MYELPEQKARKNIDELLAKTGWVVQDRDKIDFNAGTGIAVREYPTDVGPADYILFVDREPVGVIEAKREEEGQRLTAHETQIEDYALSNLKHIDNKPLPFIYESTGSVTRFSNGKDPKPRFRNIFTFHRPETLGKWYKEGKSLRTRLQDLPELPTEGLRDCQIVAIKNLERSFKDNKPRALIQMATGSGKTYTAITFIYRLLKYSDAGRVLFLVDTKNLGEQAEQEFMAYIPSDDNRKFTELYNVQRLKSRYITKDSQVCISTIQRLYSILKGEELEDIAEEENPNERWQPRQPVEVTYNDNIPIEFFDFIVIDECHRSIYNLWKQVLDYFDSFLIGLTATPDKRTFGFFNENVVSEYSHEDAVADGVNVGYDIYTIKTEISEHGARIEAKEYVDKRERLSRKKRWEQVDEPVEYSNKELDREVVNPSQIRNIIKTFKNKLPEIFPSRREVPKTLIFAKTDSHADDIIQIVREEFNEGNAFCKKITYNADEDPKSLLSQFRNDYYPRLAVTVDMISTGTDVKPIECLLFMRDVKSRNYYEQMKGRGTRTLDYENLKRVTPSVVTDKTHFVIVDAVGVTERLKTDSRPLERSPSVPLKDLLNAVMMGAKDEDVYTSLASRLSRLDKEITDEERKNFQKLSNGKDIKTVVRGLLDAYNPDKIEEKAAEISGTEDDYPQEVLDQAREELTREARTTFTGELNNYIVNVRKIHDQIIDNINIDKIKQAGWDTESKEKAEGLVEDFKTYLEKNRDEITALRIFYDQPYRMREVTFRMIKELSNKIKSEKPSLAPLRVWKAYEQLEKVNGRSPKDGLVALVSLIRRVTGIDEVLTPYDKTVDRNFQKWVFKKQEGTLKFNQEQMDWLRMLKEHIQYSFHINKKDLNLPPFDALGGIGRMYQLFGDEMDDVIDDLNENLVA